MFDSAWVDSFIECWNEDPEARMHFCGLGVVAFQELSEVRGVTSVVLHWDETGTVRRHASLESPEFIPTFAATTCAWQAFMSGKLGARRAVMSGRIKYRGSMLFAIKHGDSFDWIPKVAHRAMRGERHQDELL